MKFFLYLSPAVVYIVRQEDGYHMDSYIKFVINRPIMVIVLLAIITVLLGTGIPKLEFDNSAEVMMPKKDSRYIYNEEVKKIYGNIGKFILMSVTGDDIWHHDFIKEFDNLITDLEEYRDYDKEREDARRRKFNAIISNTTLSKNSLIDVFTDDPSFQRDLSRKISNTFGSINALDRDQLQLIQNQINKSIRLKKQMVVDEIISPITAKDISGVDDTLQTQHLIEVDHKGQRILPVTDADFMAFKQKLVKNPAFRNALYATSPESGQITDFGVLVRLININKDDEITKEIWDIANSYKELSIIVQGVPVINKFMNDYMKKDLFNFLPLVILVVLIVFYLNFRSFRGVFLPLLALIMTDIWVIGLMGHLGIKMTIMGVSLPSLMIAIGSSYSIHILNQYYIDFDDITKKGKKKGLRLSMSHISITVLLAGLTTFISFLSLQTNQVTGIREWGLFSAIGVLFTVLISTSLIPAGLMLMPHKESFLIRKFFGSSKKTWVDPVIRLFVNCSTRHHKAVLVVTGILLFISVMGLLKINVETSVLAYFKETDYIRTSTRVIGEKFGGAAGFSILIDSGKTDGVMDPDFLKLIDSIRAWLLSDENMDLNIGFTAAFPDILKSMHMAMNNDDPEFYKIPDTREEIIDYLEIYSGDDENEDGRIDDFESFVDPEFRTALVFAKLYEKSGYIIGTGEIRIIQNTIGRYLAETLPDTMSYKIAGEPSIFVALSDYVVKGQLYSLFFCLFAVGLIMTLLFKNWKAGFISLIPMSVAVIINFGIMGWFGINLDTATAIIASVAVGIGVDDTIHFLNTFRHFRINKFTVDEAIVRTLSISGKAICYTSLALIFGYSVLITSNFKPIILVGILIAITMAATTIGALMVLPAVIKATNVSLEKSASDSLFWRIFYIGRFFNLENK